MYGGNVYGSSTYGGLTVFQSQYLLSLSVAFSFFENHSNSPNTRFSAEVLFAELAKNQADKTFFDSALFSEQHLAFSSSGREFVEMFTLSESVLKSVGRSTSEFLSISEVTARLSSFDRSMSDSFVLGDDVMTSVEYIRLFSEVVAVTEFLIKLLGMTFLESLALAENLVRLTSASRTLEDVIALVEVISKKSGRTESEVFAFIESFIKGESPGHSEVTTFTDSPTKSVGRHDSTALDVSEFVLNAMSVKQLEQLILSETYFALVGKRLSDDEVLAESIVTATSFAKAFSESESLIDFVVKSTGFTESDAIGVVASLVKSMNTRVLSEMTISEMMSSTSEAFRLILDSIFIAETVSKLTGKAVDSSFFFLESTSSSRDVTQSTDFAINDAFFKDFGKTADASLSLNDITVKAIGKREFSELVLAEIHSKMSGKSLVEAALLMTESSQRTIEFLRLLASSVFLIETISKGSNVSQSDTQNLAEALIKHVSKNNSENITFTEMLSIVEELVNLFIETLVIAETTRKTFGLSDSAALMFAENLQSLANAFRTHSENVAFFETIQTLTQYTRSNSESLSLADQLLKSIGLLKSDFLVFSEQLFKTLDTLRAESLTLFESISKDVGKINVDVFSIADFLQRLTFFQRMLSELVELTDSLRRTSDIANSEVIGLDENTQKSVSHVRSQTVELVEEAILNFGKYLIANESLSDTVATLSGTSQGLLENFVFTLNARKDVGSVRTDTFTIFEEMLRISVFITELTDAVSLAKQLSIQTGVVKSDTIDILESLLFSASHSIEDTAQLSDSFKKEIGRHTSEVLTLADFFANELEFRRMFSELTSLTDESTLGVEKREFESATLSDSVSSQSGSSHDIAESFQLSVTARKSTTKVLSIFLSVFDSLISRFSKSLSENESLSDVLNAISEFAQSPSENVNIASSISKSVGKKDSESISISETVTLVAEFMHSLLETFSFIENMSKSMTLRKADAEQLTELLTRITDRLFSDSLTFSEIAVRTVIAERIFDDTILFVDSLEKSGSVRMIDILSLTDFVNTDNTSSFSIAELCALQENISKLVSRRTTESIVISETRSTVTGFRNISSLTFSETFIKEAQKQNVDSISLSDVLSTATEYRRALMNELSLSDEISMTQGNSLSMLEQVALTDVLRKTVSLSESSILILTEQKTQSAERRESQQLTLTDMLSSTSEYHVQLAELETFAEILFSEKDHNRLSLFDIIELTDAISKMKQQGHGNVTLLTSTKKKVFLSTRAGNKTHV